MSDYAQPTSKRPPQKFLEELGWLTISWSRLESIIEMSCAYMFQAKLTASNDAKPPKPFGARLKYLRRNLAHPAFAHLRAEFESALMLAQSLADERNERMHGAYSSLEDSEVLSQTVIKSHDSGYVAIQDIEVSVANLTELADRIGEAFGMHFNLMDRMKATIRAFEGHDDIGKRMHFGD